MVSNKQVCKYGALGCFILNELISKVAQIRSCILSTRTTVGLGVDSQTPRVPPAGEVLLASTLFRKVNKLYNGVSLCVLIENNTFTLL